MNRLALILVGAAVVNTWVLSKRPGLRPLGRVPQRFDEALLVALGSGFLLTLASGLTWTLREALLEPRNLDAWTAPLFIAMVLAIVAVASVLLRVRGPQRAHALGIYRPLIGGHALLLGLSLLAFDSMPTLVAALLQGGTVGLVFGLVLMALTALCERLATADVPAPFRGSPILLVTSGLMALALVGVTRMAG